MRKKPWFNPNHVEANHKKTVNRHTPGKEKGDNCQKSAQKVELCRARAYKTCRFYGDFYHFFPDCNH
jgi:hypothetical protein